MPGVVSNAADESIGYLLEAFTDAFGDFKSSILGRSWRTAASYNKTSLMVVESPHWWNWSPDTEIMFVCCTILMVCGIIFFQIPESQFQCLDSFQVEKFLMGSTSVA